MCDPFFCSAVTFQGELGIPNANKQLELLTYKFVKKKHIFILYNSARTFDGVGRIIFRWRKHFTGILYSDVNSHVIRRVRCQLLEDVLSIFSPAFVFPLIILSHPPDGRQEFQLDILGRRYPPIQCQTGVVDFALVDAHIQNLVDAQALRTVLLVEAVQAVGFIVAQCGQWITAVDVARKVTNRTAGGGRSAGKVVITRGLIRTISTIFDLVADRFQLKDIAVYSLFCLYFIPAEGVCCKQLN